MHSAIASARICVGSGRGVGDSAHLVRGAEVLRAVVDVQGDLVQEQSVCVVHDRQVAMPLLRRHANPPSREAFLKVFEHQLRPQLGDGCDATRVVVREAHAHLLRDHDQPEPMHEYAVTGQSVRRAMEVLHALAHVGGDAEHVRTPHAQTYACADHVARQERPAGVQTACIRAGVPASWGHTEVRTVQSG